MRKDPFNDNRFIAVLALICAIFLAIFVDQEKTAFRANAPSEFRTAEVTETLNDVPVELSSDDDSYVVSGLPKTVTVRVKGPRNIVNRVTRGKLVAKTEDITKLSPGRQSIQLIIEDMPKEISYQITPSRVLVNLYKQDTITKEVSYQLAPDVLADGYKVSSVTINPVEVEVTGDERLLDRLDQVYVEIRADEPISQDFTASYPLSFVDKEGKPLRLSANVSEVTVSLTVEATSKTVPLTLSVTGESDEYSYEYEIIGSSSVEVSGSKEALDQISQINLEVDVSGLTSSQTVKGQLTAPAGVTLSLSEVEVNVTVKPRASSDNATQESQVESSDVREEAEAEGEGATSQYEINPPNTGDSPVVEDGLVEEIY